MGMGTMVKKGRKPGSPPGIGGKSNVPAKKKKKSKKK